MSENNRKPSKGSVPDPLFVLRGEEYECAVSHVKIIEDYPPITYLLTCDQMGFIDLWNLESRRKCFRFNVINQDSGMKTKDHGLIWISLLPKSTTDALIIVQSRRGQVHFFDASFTDKPTLVLQMETSCSVQTNFTAFCKCDMLKVPTGAHLAMPVDNLGESSFRVLFFSHTKPMNIGILHEGSGSDIKCDACEGLPMCATLLQRQNQLNLVVGFESANIVLYSATFNTSLCKINLHRGGTEPNSPIPVTCFAFNSDNSLLVAGTAGPTVFFVKLESSSELKDGPNQSNGDFATAPETVLEQPELLLVKQLDLADCSKGVSCISLRPDDKLFVCSTWDCALRYFSASKKNKPLAVLDWHHSSVTSLAFHDNFLFSACKEGKIVCWNLYA